MFFWKCRDHSSITTMTSASEANHPLFISYIHGEFYMMCIQRYCYEPHSSILQSRWQSCATYTRTCELDRIQERHSQYEIGGVKEGSGDLARGNDTPDFTGCFKVKSEMCWDSSVSSVAGESLNWIWNTYTASKESKYSTKTQDMIRESNTHTKHADLEFAILFIIQSSHTRAEKLAHCRRWRKLE